MDMKKRRVTDSYMKGQKILHNLLVSPKARVWRHVILIAALAAVSLNQTYVVFQQGLSALSYKLYLIVLVAFISYLFVAYYNIYMLIPKYLIKKRYLLYGTLVSISVILLLCVQNWVENATRVFLGEPEMAYSSPVTILNFVSSFVTISLCMAGGSISVLLKHWMEESQKVGQMEKMHVQSEIEQLKEQVNPQLLFNILDKSGKLAESEPEESSSMLFKLSQLLRYQLYDCSRSTVLLDAEIRFLGNYLLLEQMYSHQFEYSISAEGEIKRLFLPPLLFIPFVQWCVSQIYKQDKQGLIQVTFNVNKEMVEFTCSHDRGGIPGENDFSRIRQRLAFLYKTNYLLFLTENTIRLTLKHSEA